MIIYCFDCGIMLTEWAAEDFCGHALCNDCAECAHGLALSDPCLQCADEWRRARSRNQVTTL